FAARAFPARFGLELKRRRASCACPPRSKRKAPRSQNEHGAPGKATSVPRRARRAGGVNPAPTKMSRAGRVALGLLGGAEEDFADEALRGLGEEHGDGVGYVIGLEHFFCVLCGAMKKIGGDRAWANGCDADAVSAEVFGHAISEAEQAPFGGAIGSAAGHGVFSSEGTDVDDVATRAREHSGDDGAADEEHSLKIRV